MTGRRRPQGKDLIARLHGATSIAEMIVILREVFTPEQIGQLLTEVAAEAQKRSAAPRQKASRSGH